MKLSMISAKIWNYASAILFIGIIAIVVLPNHVFAQSKPSTAACYKKLNQLYDQLKLKRFKDIYYQAKRYCDRGDLFQALRVLRSGKDVAMERCYQQVERTMKQLKSRPNKASYEKARRLCKKGHPDKALLALRSNSGRSQDVKCRRRHVRV